MKRFSIALATGIVVVLLRGPCAEQAWASPDSVCTFDRRVGYGASVLPEPACAGRPLALKITSCSECDDVVFGVARDPGRVELRFHSRMVCPRMRCVPDSLIVPLPAYPPGVHVLSIRVSALVTDSAGQDSCVFFQDDVLRFAVDSCDVSPPPPILPFVERVMIGPPPPCVTCPPLICPDERIPVRFAGTLPNDCFEFRGLELLPSPRTGPRPEPPIVRLRFAVNDCLGRPCREIAMRWSASAMLPGLPPGGYDLMMEEVWESMCDSTRIDTTFFASLPFRVAERCSIVVPPGCYLYDWQHGTRDPRCDAYLMQGKTQLTLRLMNTVPISGFQGDLVFQPAGRLLIQDLEPVGPASRMRVAWERTRTGARFVMLDVSGHPIPPDSAMPQPVLRVTAFDPLDTRLDRVILLGARSLVASDPRGMDVPPCPTFAVIPDARICPGAGLCDFNRDGLADVRDLVLMVHCIMGFGPCPDTTLAGLDCDHDGRKTIDDIWCCARVVLHGGIPDSTRARAEPSVRVGLGAPRNTGSGLELPVRVSGADRLGGARLVFDYPADCFEVSGVQLNGASGSWVALHETTGTRLIIGLLGLGPQGADPPASLDLVLRLSLRPGEEPAGQIALVEADFSGPDGVALAVNLVPTSVPARGLTRVALSPAQPNPFSGTTRFAVTLPVGGAISLTVHDLAGRRVAEVFRGELPAGSHEFAWEGRRDDGIQLSDGIYFLRSTGLGQPVSRKVVLLRGN